MRLSLREMRRRPGRFGAAFVILTFVSLLIVYLGGLIDATVRGGTGALRAQSASVLVFSDRAQLAFANSRIDAGLRTRIEEIPGVTTTGGLGVTQLGARLPGSGSRDLIDVAVFGYESPTRQLPSPPADGTAFADSSLRSTGVENGMMIHVGPARTPLTIVGFVDDTTFDGQGTLWTPLATWGTIQSDNRPAKAAGEGAQQVLAVDLEVGSALDQIRAITDVEVVEPADAVDGLPGVVGTRDVFGAIIIITTFVAGSIVALLFALLVVERVSMYGVLKALGVNSWALFVSLATQAVVIATTATVAGTGLGLVFGRTVASGPNGFVLTPSRVLSSAALVLAAALIGAAISLRRVLAIDPASSIGSST